MATHVVPGDGLPGRHDAGITLLGGLAPQLQVTASAAKKKPGKTGLFLCCDDRSAQRLRAFNHALICGSDAARSFTRVWIVLMALSAACREVGAMY